MKILLFIDSLGPGGAQRQLVGLASFLNEKQYIVKVITYHNEPFYESFLKEKNIDFEVVKGANIKSKRIFCIRRAIKKFQPNTIISYLDTPSIIACLIRLTGLKFKLIVSERNTTQINNLKEKIKFLFFKVADVIITNSFSQKEFISKNYPSLNEKTNVITNFVDLDFFKNDIKYNRNKIPKILVIASIWPSKNTLLFIDALKILDEKGFQFELIWYGKDNSNIDYFNQCFLKIKNYNLSNKVFLLDKTSDILKEYLKADFFCLPSLYEGTPNVICEAISCGLPVVCSDVCDNSIYVQEGINGFLFDPKSTVRIAEKIQEALSIDDETYNMFRIQSRKIAEKKLSKDQFIKKHIEYIV